MALPAPIPLDSLTIPLTLDISLLFISALSGVLLPLYLRHQSPLSSPTLTNIFNHGNTFSGGILLSAALMHLLPQSERSLQETFPNLRFPLAHTLTLLGILLIYITDNTLTHTHSNTSTSHLPLHNNTPRETHPLLIKPPNNNNIPEAQHQTLLSYLLLTTLSLHSLLEGLALGTTLPTSKTPLPPLLLAILSHKFLAAFTLGISLTSPLVNISQWHVVFIAVIFAAVSPVGAVMGFGVVEVVSGEGGGVGRGVCGGLVGVSAGVFIWLGFELVGEGLKDGDGGDEMEDEGGVLGWIMGKGGKIVSFVVGAGLMALLALWV